MILMTSEVVFVDVGGKKKVGQVSVIEIVTTGDNNQTHTMIDHRWSSTVSLVKVFTFHDTSTSSCAQSECPILCSYWGQNCNFVRFLLALFSRNSISFLGTGLVRLHLVLQ